jgi:tellurite resistance protein TehA-like permease
VDLTPTPHTRLAALGLAGAGLLLGLGGGLHPNVESGAGYEDGLAGMFASSTWTVSHALMLAGFALLVTAMAVLLREAGRDWTTGRRRLGWAVAGGVLAAVEGVPHLLASGERDALLAGDGTPLTDLHAALQAVSTPLVGLSVAALAVATARDRALGAGRVAAAVAVVGGLAFALAGPLIALTKGPGVSPLFAGAAGVALWLVVAGVRTAHRLRGVAAAPEPAAAAAR